MKKVDRYLNENFSWTVFLSWTFIAGIKYLILTKQILKAIAEEKEPANAKVDFALSKKISTIVGETVKISSFLSTEMTTFVLRDEIFYSSALEGDLTEDEIIALILYEFNAKKKNLKTKENITGHLKFGLPFEIFVALLYAACPSLMNWLLVFNVAIPIFLDKKYMEYIKKLNTFSGDTYVTSVGYGPHLLNALMKIRAYQRKKLHASFKNVDDVEKKLDKINISKMEPTFGERVKNLIDLLANNQAVVTTNILYKKMKDLLDSGLLKKNGPKPEEKISDIPTTVSTPDVVVEPTIEKPKIEKKVVDKVYLEVVAIAKTNPEITATDIQIKFNIPLTQAQKYIRKMKDEKIIDSKYFVVKRELTRKPKAVETPVVEPPKVEVKAVEAPKIEAPKVIEQPKIEAPKVVEKPKKVETPKKAEKPVKVEPVKVEAPKVEKHHNLDQAEYEDVVDSIRVHKQITYEMIQRDFRISRAKAVEYVKQMQKDNIVSATLKVINPELKAGEVASKDVVKAQEYKEILEFAKTQIGVSVSILQKEFRISPTKAKEFITKLLKDGIINKEGDVLLNSTKINKVSPEEAKEKFKKTDKIIDKLDRIIADTETGEDEDPDSKTGRYQSDNLKALKRDELRKRLLNRGK